jgi:hypothetical protein
MSLLRYMGVVKLSTAELAETYAKTTRPLSLLCCMASWRRYILGTAGLSN